MDNKNNAAKPFSVLRRESQKAISRINKLELELKELREEKNMNNEIQKPLSILRAEYISTLT